MEKRISTDIPYTLKEGAIFSLSPNNKLQQSKNIKSKKLEETINIKMYGQEKVIEVQRQHPIVLLVPSLIILLLILISISPFFLLPLQTLFKIPNIILIEFFLIMIGLILIFSTYAFMYWYYQFYVITDKCLFHRHFFRVGGYYSEEVFLETSPERDIKREAPNVFYSLLNIDDVTVLFQRPGLEVFVFKAPENAQGIEDALEEVILIEQERGKK